MTSNDKELAEWSDEDVYYWVYQIGAGDVQEHALAIWNAAITGKQLVAMKKREFHDLFKTLDKDITSNLWREIKKLQKQGRKSIFGKRKPTPITPDYPGDADDSFDEDSEFDSSEEDETEVSEDMNNHSSLPERLKERLREFKAQQEELNREPQDMYIAPDADSSEQQDTYEQFSEGEDQYLTPPNEEEDAPPPPVPSRAPIDSKHMGAPDLPPRPGPSPSRALPKPNPPPIEEESDDVSVSPLVDQEYIVPDSQGDIYLPPKETDFGETYIEPMNVQPVPPKIPQGLSKPPIPSPQRPQVPVNNQLTKPYPKPSEIGKKPPLPISNNDRPSSVLSRMKKFEQPPPAQPPKPATPGSNLWKIQSQRATNNTNSLTPPGRKVTPSPPSPKRAIAPRPAPPLPKANQRSLPVPLPPRPTPSPPVPVSSRPAVPPSSRPIQPLPRTNQPELPKPPVPQPSRPVSKPKDDVSNLSDCEWFHEVLSREEATSALQRYREDGSFVVRYSTKKPNFPYTLQLFYKGKIRNLQIGLRDDNKYALGALKEGETRFSSVRELIEYHRTHDVVLANNEGRTCLLKPVPIP